jgi:hypothetical protein
MTDQKQRTGLGNYIGGILGAMEEFIVDTRECVDAVLEHTDAVRRSAFRTARCVLRPGSSSANGSETEAKNAPAPEAA